MNRQQTIEDITKRLQHMDDAALEGLLQVLKGIEPKLSASGLPYTGDPETDEVLDDPEMTSRALEWKAQFEGLSEEEKDAKIEEMLESGELIPWEKVKAEMGL